MSKSFIFLVKSYLCNFYRHLAIFSVHTGTNEPLCSYVAVSLGNTVMSHIVVQFIQHFLRILLFFKFDFKMKSARVLLWSVPSTTSRLTTASNSIPANIQTSNFSTTTPAEASKRSVESMSFTNLNWINKNPRPSPFA